MWRRNSSMLDHHFKGILEDIGEDTSREGLRNTPKRAAAAFEFLTQGYKANVTEIVNGALFPSTNSDMVVVKDMLFYALCEHHLLPFWGKCHVGYLPNGKILGLSKIPRLVEVVSRKLQVQENLTQEIANLIQKVTGAKGVGVLMSGQHMCSMMRGVQQPDAAMVTSSMLGDLTKADVKSEFYQRLKD